MTTLSPEESAEVLIEELDIQDIEDLKKLDLIAYARGAIVREVELNGAEARLSAIEGNAIISVSSSITSSQRRRFNIAHELGHWEMYKGHHTVVTCVDEDIENEVAHNDKGHSFEEWQANEFASALLMPKKFFARLCQKKDPSFNLIRNLAIIFDTSMTATSLRYLNFSSEACAIVFSQKGCIKWFKANQDVMDLDLFINIGEPVSSPSLVADYFFKEKPISEIQHQVPISTWFSARKGINRGSKIKEQSISIPSSNGTLTLLWLNEDVEGDFLCGENNSFSY